MTYYTNILSCLGAGIQFDALEFAVVCKCRVQFVGRIPGLRADTQSVGKGIPVGI